MAMCYVKVFYDWERFVAPMPDEEAGCLFKAILAWASRREEKPLRGMAAAVFPLVQALLDRDRETYGRRAGGGREKEEEGDTGGKEEKEKDEDQDEEKDEDQDRYPPPAPDALDRPGPARGSRPEAPGLPSRSRAGAERDSGGTPGCPSRPEPGADTDPGACTRRPPDPGAPGGRSSPDPRAAGPALSAGREDRAPSPSQGAAGGRRAFPTPDQVAARVRALGLNVDPRAFHDYYAARAWRLGSAPMADLDACLRTWDRIGRNGGPGRGARLSAHSYTQRPYTEHDLGPGDSVLLREALQENND